MNTQAGYVLGTGTILLIAAGLIAVIVGNSASLRASPLILSCKLPLKNVALGDSQRLSVGLHNSSDQPIRLVGNNAHCTRDYCLSITDRFPMTLNAGEKRNLNVRILAVNPKFTQIPLEVYFEDSGGTHLAAARIEIGSFAIPEK